MVNEPLTAGQPGQSARTDRYSSLWTRQHKLRGVSHWLILFEWQVISVNRNEAR